jgi:two-component system cell cycle response regulator DivK
VVDDDDRNRKLAQDVLRRSGLRTIEAASGAVAVAVAGDRVPDVVLLDLHLPDMEGRDVARALREVERTADIPVVALTALRYPDGGARLLADGFSGYLEKPIDVRTFPDQVRGYCGRPRA